MFEIVAECAANGTFDIEQLYKLMRNVEAGKWLHEWRSPTGQPLETPPETADFLTLEIQPKTKLGIPYRVQYYPTVGYIYTDLSDGRVDDLRGRLIKRFAQDDKRRQKYVTVDTYPHASLMVEALLSNQSHLMQDPEMTFPNFHQRALVTGIGFGPETSIICDLGDHAAFKWVFNPLSMFLKYPGDAGIGSPRDVGKNLASIIMTTNRIRPPTPGAEIENFTIAELNQNPVPAWTRTRDNPVKVFDQLVLIQTREGFRFMLKSVRTSTTGLRFTIRREPVVEWGELKSACDLTNHYRCFMCHGPLVGHVWGYDAEQLEAPADMLGGHRATACYWCSDKHGQAAARAVLPVEKEQLTPEELKLRPALDLNDIQVISHESKVFVVDGRWILHVNWTNLEASENASNIHGLTIGAMFPGNVNAAAIKLPIAIVQ